METVTGNYRFDFTTTKTPAEVVGILLHIPSWWSGYFDETIEGESKKVGDEFTFLAGNGMHYSKQKLIELVPGKKIVWEVTDSKLTFLKDEDEWSGTQIVFELSTEGNKTTVSFTHKGLLESCECFDACSSGWAKYLGGLKTKLQ